MKRFVTLRISVGALLMILLALMLVVVGVVMYQNYTFHNWFFSALSADSIASVTVLADNNQKTAILSSEDAEALAELIQNIRFREEPYKNVQTVGGGSGGYEIVLKTGIRFRVEAFCIEEVGLIVLGEDFYPVADLRDGDSMETKNFLKLESLYSQHAADYFN